MLNIFVKIVTFLRVKMNAGADLNVWLYVHLGWIDFKTRTYLNFPPPVMSYFCCLSPLLLLLYRPARKFMLFVLRDF